MKRRIRNLLALLLCFALVAAESSFAFAGKTGGVAETEASPGEDIQILGAGKGQIGDYTIEGNLEYGKTDTSYFVSEYYGGDTSLWTVTDKDGNKISSYRLEIRSLSFNGKDYSYTSEYINNIDGKEVHEVKQYADLYRAYRDGLKAGDKVDLRVGLSLDNNDHWMFDTPGLTTPVNPEEPVYTEGVIKDVEIVKSRITADDLYSFILYRGKNLDKQLKENRISSFGLGVGNAFLKLTETGLKKVGDFSKDSYELTYGEDFSFSVEYEDYSQEEKKSVYIDVTENYEFDLEGYKLTLEVRDNYRMGANVREIQAGTTADGLREILKKYLYLYKNDVKVTPDASKLEIDSIRVSDRISSNQIPVDDDDAITEALSETGRYISIDLSLETGSKDGEPVYVHGYIYLRTMKNAYNLYLEPFEEVAHTTGASYERTAHDFMVNLYALKNESEKIRVEDKNGRFLLKVYDEEKDETVCGPESDAVFSKIRGGDVLDCYVHWFIPIEDEDREDDGDRTFSYEEDLKFFAYDASKDVTNPYSEAHNTDGQSITELPQGAPSYVFDEEKSNTLVGGVKVNIAKKFDSYVSLNGFDANAKKRYKVNDKKIAKIDKKGNIIPKKSGKITVTLEQKVKGSGWTQIGDPIELFIQVPEMKKEAEGAAGQTLDAKTFLGKTSYAPTSWKSSKPAVAEVDEKTGIVTMKKKGKAKIIAVYGEGKNSSKKKYKTKLKVNG